MRDGGSGDQHGRNPELDEVAASHGPIIEPVTGKSSGR